MIFNLIGVPLAIINVKIIKDYSRLETLLHEVKHDREVRVENLK